MAFPYSGNLEWLESEVPTPVYRTICRAIREGHEEAYRTLQDKLLSDDLFRDGLWSLRRVLIERNLEHTLKRHPNVSVKPTRNAANNCTHMLVQCGSVMLTVSSVRSPGEMPDESVFRQEYAIVTQGSLLEVEDDLPVDAKLYAIVTHCAFRPSSSAERDEFVRREIRFDLPSSIQVILPDKNYKKLLAAPIDLIARFPEFRNGKARTHSEGTLRLRDIPDAGSE